MSHDAVKASGMFFLSLGEDYDEDELMCVAMGFVSLATFVVPVVVGVAYSWRSHQAQSAHAKKKDDAKTIETEFDNPVAKTEDNDEEQK